MTMVKKLTKHGNSLALVIDKPVLELLGAGPETFFDITTDGHALVLTPIKDAGRQKAFNSALGMVNEKYSRALRRLAE
jgi:antitoxin component of MazEF toxin-antitoxin module